MNNIVFPSKIKSPFVAEKVGHSFNQGTKRSWEENGIFFIPPWRETSVKPLCLEEFATIKTSTVAHFGFEAHLRLCWARLGGNWLCIPPPATLSDRRLAPVLATLWCLKKTLQATTSWKEGTPSSKYSTPLSGNEFALSLCEKLELPERSVTLKKQCFFLYLTHLSHLVTASLASFLLSHHRSLHEELKASTPPLAFERNHPALMMSLTLGERSHHLV